MDSDNVVWIGSYGGGLSRWQDGTLTNYGPHNGLPDSVVSRIVDDGAGNLWMTGNAGVFKATRNQLNELARGERERIDSLLVGVDDGMLSSECNGGGQPAGVLDAGRKVLGSNDSRDRLG